MRSSVRIRVRALLFASSFPNSRSPEADEINGQYGIKFKHFLAFFFLSLLSPWEFLNYPFLLSLAISTIGDSFFTN